MLLNYVHQMLEGHAANFTMANKGGNILVYARPVYCRFCSCPALGDPKMASVEASQVLVYRAFEITIHVPFITTPSMILKFHL